MNYLNSYKQQMFTAYNFALVHTIHKHLGINALFDKHKEEKERNKFLILFEKSFKKRSKHYLKFLAESPKEYKKDEEKYKKLHEQIENIILSNVEQEIHSLGHKMTAEHLVDLAKTVLGSVIVQLKSHKLGNIDN